MHNFQDIWCVSWTPAPARYAACYLDEFINLEFIFPISRHYPAASFPVVPGLFTGADEAPSAAFIE